MKRNVSFLLCMILTVVVFGQNQKLSNESIQPQFSGIEKYVPKVQEGKFESINDYLVQKINYPERCASCWLEGTEVVQFEVTTDGNLKNFNVINSVSSDIDREVIRVLKTTDGMWKPGYLNGSPVDMQKEVSIVFKMSESADHEKLAQMYFAKGNKHLLVKGNTKKALRCFDKGIALRPNEKCLLFARGLCLYKIGNNEDGNKNKNRIKRLGGIEAEVLPVDYRQIEGYAELMSSLKN